MCQLEKELLRALTGKGDDWETRRSNFVIMTLSQNKTRMVMQITSVLKAMRIVQQMLAYCRRIQTVNAYLS